MRISDWSSDVCSSDLKDTDTLLRIAAVANKAQRRMTQKEEHVLDPASAVARVPLKLTKRFTEKLNHDGSAERSESQEISVTNGTARMPSFESINAIFGVRDNPTQGVTPKVKVMDEVERFLQGKIGRASCRERVCQYV